MSIRFYNSLTRRVESFSPVKPPWVNIYSCGVTVYDDCHIGHARSLFIFDLLRRYLLKRGFKVNFVRNITDIDDKIIRRSKELKRDWMSLVKDYIQSYYEDLNLLDIGKADFEPRATEHIPEMIDYIKGLIDRGYAYVTDSGVYFSVRQFKDYGRLSGQSVEQMLSGTRIEPDEYKKDPLDFALWKKAKEDEPFWSSPWGPGRPGWHIECVVMSQKYSRNPTLDIHAGGRDLVFPHHENEIAQAEAYSGLPFARYWLHHGLLTINGQKMSKSLGNFVTIKDFIQRHKNPDFLKLFFLSAHYSHPIDYTEDRIEEAKKAYERIMIFFRQAEDKISQKKEFVFVCEDHSGLIKKTKEDFFEAMDDDLNTPQALAIMFDLVSESNKRIEQSLFVSEAVKTLKEFANVFGLYFLEKGSSFLSSGISEEEIERKIKQRQLARANKDFALADEIRKELEKEGIILEDTKQGRTLWRKKL